MFCYGRFVRDTCRRLKEKKSYMIYTAVGCLGIAALSDLVNEVYTTSRCFLCYSNWNLVWFLCDQHEWQSCLAILFPPAVHDISTWSFLCFFKYCAFCWDVDGETSYIRFIVFFPSLVQICLFSVFIDLRQFELHHGWIKMKFLCLTLINLWVRPMVSTIFSWSRNDCPYSLMLCGSILLLLPLFALSWLRIFPFHFASFLSKVWRYDWWWQEIFLS